MQGNSRGAHYDLGDDNTDIIINNDEVDEEDAGLLGGITNGDNNTLWGGFQDWIRGLIRRLRRGGEERVLRARTVTIGDRNNDGDEYGGNAVCNRKYGLLSFLPLVLYEQFRMFYNLFFLLVALSQFVPQLQVGFFWTYFGPLTFVLMISMGKEGLDDLKRARRDWEINEVRYTVVVRRDDGDEDDVESGDLGLVEMEVAARDIRVGDVLVLRKDARVPADCVMLRACDDSGGDGDAIFIRTDQLDGETDWKLRRPVVATQHMSNDAQVLGCGGKLYASAPYREIYDFVGTFIAGNGHEEPLSLENTLWAHTVVASGRALALVLYTGVETRSVLNTSVPKSKVGLLDHEVNYLSKLLFGLLLFLSLLLTVLRGLTGQYIMYFFRYFLLLSAIIPISMRVNLDMAKLAYSYTLGHDKKMLGCVVRNSNLPEELGRVHYLLTDKTGTLTQNLMTFKKLHVGNALFSRDTLSDISSYTPAIFSSYSTKPTIDDSEGNGSRYSPFGGIRSRIETSVSAAVLAIALAHNVTPITDESGDGEVMSERSYQAASPDEVALVEFAARVGVELVKRTQDEVVLRSRNGQEFVFEILVEFPFTPASKRMGIIVRCKSNGKILFLAKGADSVMGGMVKVNDWLDEESGNMAREGLRTLVFAQKELSEEEYRVFEKEWEYGRLVKGVKRKGLMAKARRGLERNMLLIGLTGVEDRLDVGVRETLEKLRHAGIRVWMLTGDKVETAMCIAVSSRLAERRQGFYVLQGLTDKVIVAKSLKRYLRNGGVDVFVIDGETLGVVLDDVELREEFIQTAASGPSVVCCRCSPTQKAAVAGLLQTVMGKQVAAIGDGGNDVSMIQEANVGIGIPGKEGMQASLASDFSVMHFCDLVRLFLWHGRNSYKRSARLAQFVMHRGLIISVIQVVYCALFFYAAISVYSGWILVGYATLFTMLPVFSLILDEDVSEDASITYPELYKDVQKGRSLNVKTFLTWVFKSIYQGTMIMVLSVYVLWDNSYFTTMDLSGMSFTALMMTELLMVASEVRHWHWMMVLAEMTSVGIYLTAIVVLKDVFDQAKMFEQVFLAKVVIVTAVSCLPVTLGKWLKGKFAPAAYSKLA